jgi:epoxyqueuosine reductase
VASELPVTVEPAEPSPCVRCTTKPCISTCPASALFADRLPDVGACVSYRTATDSKSGKVSSAVETADGPRYDPDNEPGSVCALTCLARQACPVGASHRYSESQMRYFYGRSLTSIRKYLAAQRSAV